MYKNFKPLKNIRFQNNRSSSKISSRDSSTDKVHEDKIHVNVAIFDESDSKNKLYLISISIEILFDYLKM